MQIRILLVIVGLAGCANTPELTYPYYHPIADIDARLTRTLRCGVDNQPIAVNSTSIAASYRADLAAGLQSFELKKLDSPFANISASFSSRPDGRLAGINSTTEGGGSNIVAAAIGLGQSISAIPKIARAANPDKAKESADGGKEKNAPSPEAKACKALEAIVGENEPLTLVFSRSLQVDQSMEPSGTLEVGRLEAKYYEDNLREVFGSIRYQIDMTPLQEPTYTDGSKGSGDFVSLQLKKVAMATVRFFVHYNGDGKFEELTARSVIVPWTPDCGPESECKVSNLYPVLVPKARAFGDTTFQLALSEAGAVTTLRYAKEGGLAAALGSTSAVVNAASTTESEELARIRTQADLIAQQQRLANCLADSATCE